jgi:hypothetical protein
MARQLIKPDSENAIQAAFFKWCGVMERQHPELALMHSIPNGAHKSHASRYVFKLTGLKPGVPDVSFPVARCGFHGMYIEFKSKTGRISPEQKWWTERLTAEGYLVLTCRDWEIAAGHVQAYLNGTYAIRSTAESV